MKLAIRILTILVFVLTPTLWMTWGKYDYNARLVLGLGLSWTILLITNSCLMYYYEWREHTKLLNDEERDTENETIIILFITFMLLILATFVILLKVPFLLIGVQ